MFDHVFVCGVFGNKGSTKEWKTSQTPEMSHQPVKSHRSYSSVGKKKSEINRVPFVFFLLSLSVFTICLLLPLSSR